MQRVRRSVVAWCVAAFVPLLLLGMLYIAFSLQQNQREAEDRALGRAVAYLAQVDAKLQGDLGALTVLAGLQSLRSGAMDEAKLRAIRVREVFPYWRNVILTNETTGEVVWATDAQIQADFGLQFLTRSAISEVGGSQKGLSGCHCVRINRRVGVNGYSYVLTVERDVSDLWELLRGEAGSGEIAALVDRDGLFIARSADQEKRFGTPATEYVRKAVARGGKGIYSGVTYEGVHNRTAYATSTFSHWSAHIAVPSKSYQILSAGYLTFAILSVSAALLFAAGVTLYGIRDLKERQRAERTRMQSYKLEAIGALSSAVAHDFNNLLSIMTACVRVLGTTDDHSKKEKVIQEGLAAADRGAKLVRQLLTFARDKPPELTSIDLNAAVEGIRDLLIRALGNGVKFEVNIPTEAQYVRTNGPQLELVLINLAVNARDAMPNGGSFSITSRKAPVPDCVDMLIKDTGVGMSQDVAARAFDPFFTTKPEGKGTGLGLAQAHLLAKDSGGSLHLETSPGKGAIFILRFPACGPESL